MQLVNTDRDANVEYAKSLGRAFAGAIIFSLPLMMTMEMWWIGFYLDRDRLLQFVLVNFLVVVALSRLSGFEPTIAWYDDLMDSFAAYGVAVVAATLALALFGIIIPGMPTSEVVGKIAIQTVPASFGAMLASKQLGSGDEDAQTEKERNTYLAQLFLMFAGAIFLSLSVAPTEEMMLISYRMSVFHALALVVASIAMLHALVYSVGFRGQEKPGARDGPWGTFFRFSIVGYGIAVLTALYVLWSFGRTDGVSLPQMASVVAVLAFPGAVGAAIARLVI